MKHFLFLLFFAYTNISFSQTEYQLFVEKYEEFVFYAKPNKTNKLSKYFKNHIDSDLLNKYQLNDTIRNKKYVYLTFRLDIHDKITNIMVNSAYFELNKSIREAFKNYDIEDLNISEKSPLNIYTLQILSKEGDKMVINCSTDVVYDRLPIYEGCESSINQSKLSTCFYKQISEHIVNNISLAAIKKAKIIGMLDLNVKFLINKQGVIEQINCKAPTDSLTQELNRVVALFPKAKIPAYRNGNPTDFTYRKTIGFQVDSDDEKYKEEIEKHNEELLTKDTLISANSQLALHFKNYISPAELSKIVLPLRSRYIYLSFTIDKKGKPINIKTTSDSPKLNNQLVEIFNKFPFEKLNVNSSNSLESFKYPIIIERFNKNFIMSSDTPTVFIPPVFDEDCEKSKNPDELYKCLDQNINSIVKDNFKNNIKHKTNLNGIISISCYFQIDTDGKIINVKGFAPNPVIANELEEIIKKISKVYKPAYSNAQPTKTSYRYSYRYNLGNNEINDFQNLVKTSYHYQKK